MFPHRFDAGDLPILHLHAACDMEQDIMGQHNITLQSIIVVFCIFTVIPFKTSQPVMHSPNPQPKVYSTTRLIHCYTIP